MLGILSTKMNCFQKKSNHPPTTKKKKWPRDCFHNGSNRRKLQVMCRQSIKNQKNPPPPLPKYYNKNNDDKNHQKDKCVFTAATCSLLLSSPNSQLHSHQWRKSSLQFLMKIRSMKNEGWTLQSWPKYDSVGLTFTFDTVITKLF